MQLEAELSHERTIRLWSQLWEAKSEADTICCNMRWAIREMRAKYEGHTQPNFGRLYERVELVNMWSAYTRGLVHVTTVLARST